MPSRGRSSYNVLQLYCLWAAEIAAMSRERCRLVHPNWCAGSQPLKPIMVGWWGLVLLRVVSGSSDASGSGAAAQLGAAHNKRHRPSIEQGMAAV